MSNITSSHSPNHFKLSKTSVNAIPLAALSIVLYPILYTNFLTISLYLYITVFFLFGFKKIIVTQDIIKTVMIMLVGIFIMAYSYNKKPIITFSMPPSEQNVVLIDMFLTSIICFIIFILGYFYSFTVKKPLAFMSYISVFHWTLASLYFLLFYGFFLGNSLFQGTFTVVLLPYMYLAFERKPKSRLIFSLIILLYLMSIYSRTAFVAAVIFFLTYYLYPYLSASRKKFNLYFLSFIVVISILIIMYIFGGFDFLDDFSRNYFGKRIHSGRDILWPEVLFHISEEPLFGHGINQWSGYLASFFGKRNLSAHNTYLDVLLRGGLLLLLFFVILFYRIWGSFYSKENNKTGRIAAGGFLSFLFLLAGTEIGLLGNIVINSLAWFFWGIASGCTWKNNHHFNTASTIGRIQGIVP